jgi:hypothetical protein
MLGSLEEFTALYARRPIQDNAGGMSSSHLFLFWYAMRALKPTTVIESGVWQGQGTWLIEQAAPDAAIYSIDLDWSHLQYRSSRAKYLSTDVFTHDWTGLDKATTLVFFDDHVDPMKRIPLAIKHGFRHLMFEDNYPHGRGDCYSLLEVFAHTGHRKFPGLKARISRLLGRLQDRDVAPNTSDAAYVRSVSDAYEVLPPIYREATTRWGDAWPSATPAALLTSVSQPWQQVLRDESRWYTWMCYLRLH